MKVVKRDARIVNFDEKKLETVIHKSFKDTSSEWNEDDVIDVVERVVTTIREKKKEMLTVEEIQDVIESVLEQAGYLTVKHKFSKYRHERHQARIKRESLFLRIKGITKVTDRENANVGNSPSSKLLQIAEATNKEFADLYLMDETTLKAMSDLKIYPHDYTWMAVGTTTCCFIPLGKLLTNGFNSGHGYIRPPKRIRSASQLACVIFQSNQNIQHGGQSYAYFDRDLAPFVTKEYEWQKADIILTLKEMGVYHEGMDVEELAWKKTREEVYQSMKGLVFNLNTMHSRAGAQVPFTSVNIGTDTSKEARMIVECLLEAYEKGLGKGEQPLFPNIIFKVKSGINYEEGAPNHDLLRKSLQVSATRLFPTYMFQDCTLNKDFPEDVPSMGCRTRVAWNRHSEKQSCERRGNLSFTTLNLPGIALECKYEKTVTGSHTKEFMRLREKYKVDIPKCYLDNNIVQLFFSTLNEYIDMSMKQLIDRYKFQCSFKKKDFPFLMEGVWLDSEKLSPNDSVGEVLKHGALTVGFIGLAETLRCLVGKHHGENKEARELGLAIIKFLYDKVEEAGEYYDLNFGLLGTPAEGLTGKLLNYDRKRYGVIEGVTDKDWYTNSCHVPVEYEISMFEKIRIEGMFTKYCGGGTITYVELKEAPVGNIEASLAILQYMYENDVVFGALNFPSDRCIECGEYGVIEEESCPVCQSTNISRIRRITGYLAQLENFNFAKLQEALHRTNHDKI